MKKLSACLTALFALTIVSLVQACGGATPSAPTPVAEPTDPAAMPPSDTVLECDKDGRRDDLGRPIPNC